MGAFNINERYVGGQYTIEAAQRVADALKKYGEEKKQTEFNSGVFDVIKDQKDSQGNPYIPVEALEKWHSMNPDKQAGVLATAARREHEDMQYRVAHQNQVRETLNLSSEELANAGRAHVVPLRQSRGSFSYVPEVAPGTPALDAAGNQIGVYDAKGKITKLPKADPAVAIQEGVRKSELAGVDAHIASLESEMAKGEKKYGPDWNPLATPYVDQLAALRAKRETMATPAAPAGTAPSSAIAAPSSRVRVKSKDGKIGSIPTAQLKEALANGYTQL